MVRPAAPHPTEAGTAAPRAPASSHTAPAGAGLRFGRFELQPAEHRLLVDGVDAPLRGRAFDLLVALVQRAGHLVTRQELLDLVWPGLVVEENNLSVQINALRKVLGSDIVTTVPGRGYRFVAAIDGAAAPPAGAGAALAAPTPHKTNLPGAVARLLGRAPELAALRDLVARHRLVTVVGAGGVGKTRLAQALLDAQRGAYRHGVCWVELGAVTDAAAVPGVIAAALGLPCGIDDPLGGLASAVAPMALLLALDNAEHLLDAVAAAAQRLHAAAPGLHLLVTSQAPLRLADEQLLRLDGLALPPDLPAPPPDAAQALACGAVALFVDRVQAADARFVFGAANVADVVALCRMLDGSALGIELAAARAALLGVGRVRALMGERLRLLTHSRDQRAPDRQRTLRAALEWSHGLLAPREQAVFRRLAVMAGSASLALIQQVVVDPQGGLDDGAVLDDCAVLGDCAVLDDWAVLDAMGLLVERSLLTVLVGDDADAPRYRLLDTPAAFARELLRAAGEDAALRQRHALAVCAQLQVAELALRDARMDERTWQRLTAPDLYNAQQAFAWAQGAQDAALTAGLGAILLDLLPATLDAELMAVCAVCEPLLLAGDLEPALRLRAWGGVRRALGTRRHQRARAAGRQELALARSLDHAQGDRWGLFRALVDEALLAASEGDLVAGDQALAEALSIQDPDWPPVRRIRICHAQMSRAAKAGDLAEALDQGRRCVALMRAAGGNALVALDNLAKMELLSGDARAAVRTGQQVVGLLEATRDEYNLAFARINLGAAWLALDDTVQARPPLQSGWPLALRFGLTASASHLALLAALEQRPRSALRIAAHASARCAALGQPIPPNEERTLQRARSLASAAPALTPADLARLEAEGAVWRGEELAALAFDRQDS